MNRIRACSNEANTVQHFCSDNVARCWTKILSRFKLKSTSSYMVFKRGQHVISSNVGWCWTNMLAISFNRPLSCWNDLRHIGYWNQHIKIETDCHNNWEHILISASQQPFYNLLADHNVSLHTYIPSGTQTYCEFPEQPVSQQTSCGPA